MKTKSLLTFIMLFCIMNAFAQKLSVDLTFTALNNTAYVKLDSIKVMNRSQGGESILYYPDTTLSVEITPGDTLLYIGYTTGYPVGVQEMDQQNLSFQLFQSYPNPVKDHCMISMYIPEKEIVSIMVKDIQGRVVVYLDRLVDKGIHFFRFSPGSSSLYFLSVQWKGLIQSIKMINIEPSSGKRCMFDYIGKGNNNYSLKASLSKNDLVIQESGILDAPDTNQTYIFQFATNIPCPGMPAVTYEGQVYTTIQILSQCWLKENLNVGSMIDYAYNQTDNGIKEKYCLLNNPDSCTKYGGLYQWDEMMQYTAQQGARGICPPGWHVPTDEEWKVLEGGVDSQYGIGDTVWNGLSFRGFDAGTNLKTASGWYGNGNGTDLFLFSGLPGGQRFFGGFILEGLSGQWWSSTECYSGCALYRHLYYSEPKVGRSGEYENDYGFSVRCLRDWIRLFDYLDFRTKSYRN